MSAKKRFDVAILRKQGSNGLQNALVYVGMHFGKLHDNSVKIGNGKKRWMPSGKGRLRSISNCHNDDS